jgi:phage/plasmid primase-like uncharacterized protein
MVSIESEMKGKGINPPEVINFDSTIKRFGEHDACWYVAHQSDRLQVVLYGDWHEGISHKWMNIDSLELYPKEEEWIEKKKQDLELSRKEMNKQAAQLALEIYNGAKTVGCNGENHLYLKNKHVIPCGLVKQEDYQDIGKLLIIPYFNVAGQITTLQFIYENGKKILLSNGLKKGSFFTIPGEEHKILICEGYATGCSLHMATGYKTIVACDAGNLMEVAKAVRSLNQYSVIILCADDDRWKTEKGNVGIDKARQAATAIGASMVAPKFLNSDTKPTDFNDLHQLEGLPTVLKQISACIIQREEISYNAVYNYIEKANGEFSATELYVAMDCKTQQDKRTVRDAIYKLKEKNEIEHIGKRNGVYRKIDLTFDSNDWVSASEVPYADIVLPLKLSDLVKVKWGDLIVVGGTYNAGKTLFLLETIRKNYQNYVMHYINSSETSPEMFHERLMKYGEIHSEDLDTLNQQIKHYNRADSFHNIPYHGKQHIYLIDYIEKYTDFWTISEDLARIHRALNNSICIAAIQKHPDNNQPLGGMHAMQKPTLSIALNYDNIIIVKGKVPRTSLNPNGCSMTYNVVGGEYCGLGLWTPPVDKKKSSD